MRHHYTSVRMAEIRNTDKSNGGEDVEQQGLSFITGGNIK